MYKNILISIATFISLSTALAQDEQIIINESKPSYEDISYLVVEQLKLTPGFQINATTDGSFFARVIDEAENVPVSMDQNFVRVEEILKPGVFNESQLSLLPIRI